MKRPGRLIGVALAMTVAGTMTATNAMSPASSVTSSDRPAAVAPASADLLEQLKELDGVVDVTEATAPAGYRFFKIGFQQPADHSKPHGPSFVQRLTLLHKDASRPMVMFTSGYSLSSNPSRSEPTQLVDGNQLSMEYRFFQTSIPKKPNWRKQLTIRQAADDQHRVITSFKKIYRKNWITTGGSKGGMTATYHRRFYPGDVDGTVPYVAPNDVVNDKDVYNKFLANVGDDPQCRADLTAVQRRILGEDRRWFRTKTREVAAAAGETWEIPGSVDRGMEIAVIDLYFTFWQYSPQSECANVPGPDATNQEVWDWTQGIVPLNGYSDQGLEGAAPYYYQAAYQLGWYEAYEKPLLGVLKYPGNWGGENFVADELKSIKFDTAAMPDIDRWVRAESRRMLFINGGNDPWSAEPFECGDGAAKRNCFRYTVEGGTHGSRIASLPEAERIRASALVLKWAGLGGADKASREIQDDGRPARNKALDRAPEYARSPFTR